MLGHAFKYFSPQFHVLECRLFKNLPCKFSFHNEKYFSHLPNFSNKLLKYALI